MYEREESETKIERNYILDELLKDRGQRVADYGESVSQVQESNVRKHVNSCEAKGGFNGNCGEFFFKEGSVVMPI